MVATAQRFSELHSEVAIIWLKRSLQQFADVPLADLCARFDLLVIDHPSIGEAVHQELLLPLDEYLPAAFLADQAVNSVGQSHASYTYEGHQYALAIDAATPISGYRPDLMQRMGGGSSCDLGGLTRACTPWADHRTGHRDRQPDELLHVG
jgi:multiple sugar transport system substrate-binding protein